MRKFGCLSVFGLVLILLVAEPAKSHKRPLAPLTISYASVSGTRGPLWIAKDLGLFEKHGLEVDLIYIASGGTP